MVLRWFYDPDLAARFQAAAGATLQLGVVVLAIALWRSLEAVVARVARPWLVHGGRGGAGAGARLAAWGGVAVLFGLSSGSLLGLALWSIARRWPFPDALPDSWSLGGWSERLAALAGPTWTTLAVGAIASAVAIALVAGCLENEAHRQRRPGAGALALIYVPLLVPQIGFLFGVQVLFLRLGLADGWLALIWTHLLFVLPYVFLTLADPYRSLDPRYVRSALALGKPPWLVWLRIKLIMLLRPILFAIAVGFAVSVAQFLPTLFAGGGRFATLTTETLSLAGGGDRRIIGLFGFTLAALPFVGFALALAVSGWRFRHRRAMWVGT